MVKNVGGIDSHLRHSYNFQQTGDSNKQGITICKAQQMVNKHTLIDFSLSNALQHQPYRKRYTFRHQNSRVSYISDCRANRGLLDDRVSQTGTELTDVTVVLADVVPAGVIACPVTDIDDDIEAVP